MKMTIEDYIENAASRDGNYAIAYAILKLNGTMALIDKHAWGTDAAFVDCKSCMEEIVMRVPAALNNIAESIREFKDEM